MNAVHSQNHYTLLALLSILLGSSSLLSGAALAQQQPNAAHDLSGVWQIRAPVESLQTVEHTLPPLLPEAKQLYEQHLRARQAGDTSFDSSSQCKPPGEPRTLYELGYPFEIVQKPKRIDFLYQWNRLFRVIDMDQSLPDFAGPYYYGKSVGHWQGDTLVVDVIGIKGDTLLDAAGLPHSEDMHLTESFRKLNGGKTLEARLRFDDSKSYAKPWEAVLLFDKKPNGHIVEDVCEERIKLKGHYSLKYP